MKFLLIMLILFNLSSFAEDVPKAFKDSDIKRTLKNGVVQAFDGDQYMIVKRGAKKKEQKPIIVEKQIHKKNAIKVFIGYGPNELHAINNGAELDKDAFIGIGYERMLNKEFSVEIIGNTNESIMIGGGYHF